MKAPLLGCLALTSLSLVGYAVYSMSSAEPLQQRIQKRRAKQKTPATDSTTKQPIAGDAPISRIARAVQKRARAPRMPPPTVNTPDEPTPIESPKTQGAALPITRAVAEAAFDRLMTDLEEKEPEHLGERERDRLYRNVNDAFAALSARVSGDDIELLEDSYQRMQAQLSRLEIEPPRIEHTPVEHLY